MAVKIVFAAALMLCTNVLVNSRGFVAEDILRRIEELEERDRSQQAEIETLQKQNVEMETEINQLKDREEQQANRIKVLEEEGRAMLEAINELMNNDKGMAEKPSESQSYDENAETTSERNGPHFIEGAPIHVPFGGHNRIRQVGDGMTVAFFATLTKHAEHLGIHQTVVFDNSITNIGNGYHASTGVFTAPVSGVYVFSTTIFGATTSAHFEYIVNGKFMCRMYVHGTEAYETTSMTTIFNLNQGDDVSVQNADNDKRVIGSHYSTLSGFLLALTDVSSQVVG